VRIAFVSEHASPLANLGGVDAGGQNVYVAALAATLTKLGHAVVVYTRRDDPGLPFEVETPAGYVVRHLEAGPARPIPKDDIYAHVPELTARLSALWNADRPDVVHSHFWMSGLAALRAARPLELPVVHTFHALGSEKRRLQGSSDTSPHARIQEETFIAGAADRILATANAEVFELLRMGANPRSVRVVPCGVDLDQFSPDSERHDARADCLRIVTLSRLVPRKGVDTVIEALAQLRNAELIVAGGASTPGFDDDPEARRLSELARRLHVENRVRFCGPVERALVPELLRSAGVVACTPWYEPFGMVPLEAMACGVPVVASNVGGLADTVVDGLTGFHVPPRDSHALARALRRLRSPSVRTFMGRAASLRAQEHYSWFKIAASVVGEYRAVARLGVADGLASGS
jgi:D-inositol-3-phosphate glycosyltransferase